MDLHCKTVRLRSRHCIRGLHIVVEDWYKFEIDSGFHQRTWHYIDSSLPNRSNSHQLREKLTQCYKKFYHPCWLTMRTCAARANMSTLMQRIINMWNECELIKMNWCKWCAILLLMTRRHNLTKTICRKYAVWFWNKSSTLHCFGDSPIRQFLCVGRCEVHISLDKFEEKGKIFQHDFRINR